VLLQRCDVLWGDRKSAKTRGSETATGVVGDVYEEPVMEWSQQAQEPFDARPLNLTAEQEEALEALARFAQASPPTGRFFRRTAEGEEGHTHPGSVALLSAAAIIQAGLPSCPYAPPGSPVTIQFVPPNNASVLRCQHANPAHCWAGVPSTPYQC
jgi:hypothetical protein